jgi:outer membrane receptor protein involved in Fe transport
MVRPIYLFKGRKFLLRKISLFSGLSALVLGAVGVPNATAQSPAGAKPAPGSDRIEKIVVTATKQDDTVAQDLGMSLSVLSERALEERGIQSLNQIGDSVPNLKIIDAGGANLIEMRGIADISTSIQTAPTVGFYVDEHSVATSGGSVPGMALFDARRVEILRGPQGTLFGDGSLSGTVRVITNAPDPKAFSSRVVAQTSTTEGGGTNYGVKGLMNIPMVDDKIALRVAAGYRSNSGWYDNPVGPSFTTIVGPILDPDVAKRTNTNDERVTDARAALLWRFSNQFTANLTFNRSDSKVSDSFSGVSRNEKDTFIAEPRHSRDDITGLTLTYNFGPFALTSATSYFDQTSERRTDTTRLAMPLNAAVFGRLITSGWTDTGAKYKALTEELRLASTGNKTFDWTVGYFYRTEDRDWAVKADGTPTAAFAILEDWFKIKNDSHAIFGEASLDLTDKVELVAGLREFKTKRSSDFKVWGALPAVLAGAPATEALAPTNSASASEKNQSYRVVLNWRPNDDMLLYANASTGFRAGGANASAPLIPLFNGGTTVTNSFGAETMRNHELGAKTMWFDNRLQLNTYVFQMDWKNVQVNAIDGSGLLDYFFNAGRARSRGVEIEWLARVSSSFELSGGMAFLDAKYLDSTNSAFGASVVTAGNQMPRSPKSKLNLTGSYRTQLADGWIGTVVGSVSREGKSFSDAANTVAYENDAATIYNLRLGAKRGNLGFFVFGENLTNVQQSFGRGLADTTFVTNVGSIRGNYRRPRTVGIEVSAAF